MNTRHLFNAVMHYQDYDRMPVFHWGGWGETLARWHGEGLPQDVTEHAYFDAAPLSFGLPINLDLFPLFEETVLEETASWVIKRQQDGVIAKLFKGKSSIPTYIDYILKDPSGWPEYEKRLQPDPARLPGNLDAVIEHAQASNLPISISTMSLVGYLRNWMGVENMAVASMMYPDFFARTVDVISDLVCWAIDQVAPKVKIDIGWGWEDICFRTGPLIQPEIFAKYCVPGYQKIADKLRSHGCDLYLVDCDGLIDHLLPHWLEGGVNVMFPVEIGAWNADPAAMRKQYGKGLRILGGIDKLVLERDRAAIDAEIERRMPLMAEGGLVPLPDHLITPDTPLENVQYYLDRIRALRF